MSRLAYALDQLRQTRDYTNRVLDHTDPARWFEMPPGGTTHIGWQVGHLTVSQVGHLLVGVCGRTPHDGLIPEPYFGWFGKGSSPVADAAAYPAVGALRRAFDQVFEQATSALSQIDEARLDEPPYQPHWAMRTRLDAVWWNIRHEMLHAGQIGLCRRLLGEPPYR